MCRRQFKKRIRGSSLYNRKDIGAMNRKEQKKKWKFKRKRTRGRYEGEDRN